MHASMVEVPIGTGRGRSLLKILMFSFLLFRRDTDASRNSHGPSGTLHALELPTGPVCARPRRSRLCAPEHPCSPDMQQTSRPLRLTMLRVSALFRRESAVRAGRAKQVDVPECQVEFPRGQVSFRPQRCRFLPHFSSIFKRSTS